MEKVTIYVDTNDSSWSYDCSCGYTFINRWDNYCGGCGSPIEWNIDGKLMEV